MTKILVVEDNPVNCELLIRRLEHVGFATCIAVDGPAGVAAAREEQPALILMDIGLGHGKMDGWEATRLIKSDDTTAHIPVIAVTAHAGAEYRRKSLEAGCCEYETKPVQFEQLLAKIRAALPQKAFVLS